MQGNQVMADDSLRSNRYVIAGSETGNITKIENARIDTNDVYATNLNASVEVMTPAITLGDIEVLKDDKKQERRYVTMTLYDKEETTTTGYVEVTSILTNFNKQQHMLTCQLAISNLYYPITELIIPTCFSFTSTIQPQSTGTTVAVANEKDLVLGLVHIYTESNQLMAKVVFTDSPSYTSIKIKIITVLFN